MTPHGKTNHNTHTLPPASFVSCLSEYETTTSANSPEDSIPQCDSRRASHCQFDQPMSDILQGKSPHCAGGLQVRSTVSSCVGSASWGSNQACGGRCGQVRTSEHLFQESSVQKIFPNSASLSPRSGPTSRRSTWHSARASRNAARNSTSRVIASLPMKRSWSSWTRCGPASGLNNSDGGVESRHARSVSLADGSNLSGSTLGLADPAGVATGPSEDIFESRSESNQRQAASPGRKVPAPWVVSRVIVAPSADVPMAGLSAAPEGFTALRTVSFSKSYGPASGREEYPRGVWYGSQGPQQIVVGRSLRRHADAALSARLVSFSRTPSGEFTASSRRSIAGVGTEGAASASASHPSYLLAPVDPATVKGASVDERRHAPPAFISKLKLPCGVRAGAPAEINVRSYPSPMQGGRTWDQLPGLTNGDSLVLQRRLTGRGPCDSGAINSSSGDGLGIQQPGSMTRGFAIARQPPSGRARDRAICPAVTRFNQGMVG